MDRFGSMLDPVLFSLRRIQNFCIYTIYRTLSCTDAVETDFLFANIDFKRSYFILSIAFCPMNLQIYF